MKETAINSIRYLFEPGSIAVIGASKDPAKIGHSIVRNILAGGYRGKVYPVNKSGGEILGLRVYGDISEISGTVDAASIAIPAKFAVEAVRSCAKKGVKHAQIITSGFSETGNIGEEKEILSIAREANMRILGPNIFGLYSSSSSLNATFSASKIVPGRVAILTQSGALGVAMIGKTAINNIGLSAIVSLGNKADLDESDLLEYLIGHEETRVVLMYIEGVKNGERLLETLRRTTEKKPVVVIKSGRSKRGAMAAASHTGSLAGSDAIFDAVMKQCGVLRAENITEAFNWCKFLAFSPKPGAGRAVIVTNGGGIGVMATDACEKYGIDLFDDQAELKRIFEPATPSFGSTKNPIDITGGATSADYRLALTAPSESAGLASTIALYCETATFDSENLAPMIQETYKKHMAAGKPITYAIVGGESVEKAIEILKKDNIPVHGDVYEAVSSLASIYRHKKYLDEKDTRIDEAELDIKLIDKIIEGAINEKRNFLLSNEGSRVMEAMGIGVPKSRTARTMDEAVKYAMEIGYPVVLKIVSRDILHKSDAGGIALNLDRDGEVAEAFEAIMHNARSYKPDAKIDGIEVCEMVRPGVEIIIGARRDPSFGPVVMCGLGGIYVEIMKDITFRELPVNRDIALAMLKEIRSYALLLGARGGAKKDIEGVVDTLIRVGTAITRCSRITDIEINPITVYDQGKGIRAVDARVMISNMKGEKQ